MAELPGSVPVLPPATDPANTSNAGPVFDDAAGPSSSPVVPTIPVPTVRGTPFLELVMPDGQAALCNQTDTIFIIGKGWVPLHTLFAKPVPAPSPPSARAVPTADLRENEGGLDIPHVPDAIDAAIEKAARDALDVAEDAIKAVAPDMLDPVVEDAAELVEDAVEEAAEKLGFFKRQTRREQKFNNNVSNAEEALLNHPGVYQLGQSFRAAGRVATSAVEAAKPKHVTVTAGAPPPCTIC